MFVIGSPRERRGVLDPLGMRDSFLAVSENARILELAAHWLDERPSGLIASVCPMNQANSPHGR